MPVHNAHVIAAITFKHANIMLNDGTIHPHRYMAYIYDLQNEENYCAHEEYLDDLAQYNAVYRIDPIDAITGYWE